MNYCIEQIERLIDWIDLLVH